MNITYSDTCIYINKLKNNLVIFNRNNLMVIQKITTWNYNEKRKYPFTN